MPADQSRGRVTVAPPGFRNIFGIGVVHIGRQPLERRPWSDFRRKGSAPAGPVNAPESHASEDHSDKIRRAASRPARPEIAGSGSASSPASKRPLMGVRRRAGGGANRSPSRPAGADADFHAGHRARQARNAARQRKHDLRRQPYALLRAKRCRHRPRRHRDQIGRQHHPFHRQVGRDLSGPRQLHGRRHGHPAAAARMWRAGGDSGGAKSEFKRNRILASAIAGVDCGRPAIVERLRPRKRGDDMIGFDLRSIRQPHARHAARFGQDARSRARAVRSCAMPKRAPQRCDQRAGLARSAAAPAIPPSPAPRARPAPAPNRAR